MVIPEAYRTHSTIIGACRTVEDIRQAIVRLAERSDRGCIPLRHVTCQLNGYARKLKTTVKEVMSDMTAEGLIGLKRVDLLNRTFVFSAERWTAILEDELAGNHDWDHWAKDMKDFK